MENIENILKQIPQVEKVLQSDQIKEFIPVLGRGIVVGIIRDEIRQFRQNFDTDNFDVHDLYSKIVKSCIRKKQSKLQRVINATGVAIHTNLGRSPISGEIMERLSKQLSRYCNLELNLATGTRGNRSGFVEEIICNLTSAEDALIVNNNAASLFLILNEFAKGREVLISRGELVQIGGGFRIPDILKQSGASLVEVGTTNITGLDDYRKAITENTAMILSIHQSNFKMEGFTGSPSLRDLSSLKEPSVLFVRDLGSGNLLVDARFPKTFEPTVSSELSQGADLICFSGDKMLGGCQAGFILGAKELIHRLKKNPLMRMLRVDKVTNFILQEILIQYANRDIDKISLWNLIFQNKKTLNNKINRLTRNIKSENKKEMVVKIPIKSVFGGGTTPNLKIESMGIQLDIPGQTGSELYSVFIENEIPIVGYIFNDKFTLDIRTVYDDEIPALAEAIDKCLRKID